MHTLSSTYLRALFIDAIKRDDLEYLKRLVLSSQEMSHVFYGFMRNIFVVYDFRRAHEEFRSLSRANDFVVLYYNLGDAVNWIAFFVRKLWLRNISPTMDRVFFKRIIRANNLLELDVTELGMDKISLGVVQSLISFSKRLDAQLTYLDHIQVQSLLSRFESIRVRFRDGFSHGDDARKVSNLIESGAANTLDLTVNKAPTKFSFRNLDKMTAGLSDIRHISFSFGVYGFHGVSRVLQDVVNFAGKPMPKVETFAVGIPSTYFLYSFKDHTTFWSRFEGEYGKILHTLRKMPKSFKVKVFFLMDLNHGCLFADDIAYVSDLFPTDDFVFNRNRKVWTNRQIQIAENVEFTFHCQLRFMF